MASKFEWGSLARSIYIAMLWITILVATVFSTYLPHYLLLLLFCGLCLRPLLQYSGLYDAYLNVAHWIEGKRWARINEQRKKEVDRKERDKKYRHSRARDPKLPKNW